MLSRSTIFVLSVVLSSSFGLTGCSFRTTVESVDNPKHDILNSPKSNDDAFFATSSVDCENESAETCPGAVGMLVSKSAVNWYTNSYERCSSFLIDPTTLVTNSHCIPEDLKPEESASSGRMKVVFPRTAQFVKEEAQCASILYASRISDDKSAPEFLQKTDIAFIKLARPVARTYFTLNNSGLPDHLALKIFAVDPVSKDALLGTIRVKNCSTMQNSSLSPNYTSPFSPVGILQNCRIIQGNSGSAAVDESGNVRAVAHGSLISNEDSSETDTKKPMFKFPMGYATNVSCFRPPASVPYQQLSPFPANCSTTRTMDQLLSDLYSITPIEALNGLFEEWKTTKAPATFEFTLERMDIPSETIRGIFGAMPKVSCIHPQKLSKPGIFANESIKVDENTKRAVINFSAPYLASFPRIADDTSVSLVPTAFAQIALQISFDSGELERNGLTTITMQEVGEAKATTRFEVSKCED